MATCVIKNKVQLSFINLITKDIVKQLQMYVTHVAQFMFQITTGISIQLLESNN